MHNVGETTTVHEADGATFNLDSNNPEIIVQETGVDYEAVALELQTAMLKNMDLKSIYDMTADQGEEAVRALSTHYRACETAIAQYGSIDAEYVGEINNMHRHDEL